MKNLLILTARHPTVDQTDSTPYYELHCRESDTSRLQYDPKHGTCLVKSLDRTFEYVIYERDKTGYVGECAAYSAATPDRLTVAVTDLLLLAGLNHAAIITHTPHRTT